MRLLWLWLVSDVSPSMYPLWHSCERTVSVYLQQHDVLWVPAYRGLSNQWITAAACTRGLELVVVAWLCGVMRGYVNGILSQYRVNEGSWESKPKSNERIEGREHVHTGRRTQLYPKVQSAERRSSLQLKGQSHTWSIEITHYLDRRGSVGCEYMV